MSSRHDCRQQLELYRELDEIISAMRNLAQVELHRVERVLITEQQAFDTVCEAWRLTQGLVRNQPRHKVSAKGGDTKLLIAIGSERGFCGGFNEQVLRAIQQPTLAYDQLLLVGSRLKDKYATSRDSDTLPAFTEFTAAPTNADEVLMVAQSIYGKINALQPQSLVLLHHGSLQLSQTQLLPATLPAERSIEQTADHSSDIGLQPSTCVSYLPLPALLENLQQQYLLRALIHYSLISLAQENRQRLSQMQASRDHLEDLLQQLQLRMNHLRQQEIVDEIEVILGQTYGGRYNLAKFSRKDPV